MTSPLRSLALPFFRGRFTGLGARLSVPRPEDAPSAHSPGVDPDRVLVFGNGAAVGWGVRSHDLAMPGQLSRQLSAITHRGVDADVVADPFITIQNAVEHLPVDRVVTYDAIVVIIGFSDTLRMTSPRKWRRHMGALLDRLLELRSAGAEIVVQAIHRPSSIRYFDFRRAGVLDAHAEVLNEITRDLCSELPGVRFISARYRSEGDSIDVDGLGSVPSDGPQLPAADFFHLVAAAIAAQLAPLLDDHFARGRESCPLRVRQQTEEERLRAIDALRILDTPHEKRFDEIVERARILLGTKGAAFSVVDRDRVWNKAIAGSAIREFPADRAMCSVTITGNGPFVVHDVWEDTRFDATPDLRFYAGYPVQTADGIRIGALCVCDPDPRPADSVDLVLLRELALSVQRELSREPEPLGA